MPGYRESRHITEQKGYFLWIYYFNKHFKFINIRPITSISLLARKRIELICGQLRLDSGISASAFSYYRSAHFRGFTRGRNSLQLAAACIYVAARQHRVNLMLLDLSDAVAINVYDVGRTYIDLKRRLHLSLPEVGRVLLNLTILHHLKSKSFTNFHFCQTLVSS